MAILNAVSTPSGITLPDDVPCLAQNMQVSDKTTTAGYNMDSDSTGGIGTTLICVPFGIACYGKSGSYTTMYPSGYTYNGKGLEVEELDPGIYKVKKMHGYYLDGEFTDFSAKLTFPNTVAGGNNAYCAKTVACFAIDVK